MSKGIKEMGRSHFWIGSLAILGLGLLIGVWLFLVPEPVVGEEKADGGKQEAQAATGDPQSEGEKAAAPPRSEKGSGQASTQTRPTQTRPAQTLPAQSRPAPTAPAALPSDPARSEEPLPDTPTASPDEEEPLVFTDEDLKRYRAQRPLETASPQTQPEPEADPLKSLHDQAERARWREEKIAKLQQRILDLEKRLRMLEKKRLSIANPLLPRPAEKDPSDEGLSGPELLAKTDEEIQATHEELESARQELAAFLQATR